MVRPYEDSKQEERPKPEASATLFIASILRMGCGCR